MTPDIKKRWCVKCENHTIWRSDPEIGYNCCSVCSWRFIPSEQRPVVHDDYETVKYKVKFPKPVLDAIQRYCKHHKFNMNEYIVRLCAKRTGFVYDTKRLVDMQPVRRILNNKEQELHMQEEEDDY